jgi:hypothetical protein
MMRGRMEGILHAYEKKTHQYASLRAFEDLLTLRAKRPRTLEEYGAPVRLIGEDYAADPATLNEQQVREYYVFHVPTKGLKGVSVGLARAALQLFYEMVVRVESWSVFGEVRTKDLRPLPKALSRAEVAAVLVLLATRPKRFLKVAIEPGPADPERRAELLGGINAFGLHVPD